MITTLFLAAVLHFTSPGVTDTLSWEAKADTVLKYAYSQLGVTYKYGTCAPGQSFDCSGFAYYAYAKVGVKVLRSSSGLATMGFDIPLDSCRKGDMILFTGTNANDRSVGHVGIVTSNQNGVVKFIHASSGRNYGVIESEYTGSYYVPRFVCVKRVF